MTLKEALSQLPAVPVSRKPAPDPSPAIFGRDDGPEPVRVAILPATQSGYYFVDLRMEDCATISLFPCGIPHHELESALAHIVDGLDEIEWRCEPWHPVTRGIDYEHWGFVSVATVIFPGWGGEFDPDDPGLYLM